MERLLTFFEKLLRT